MESGVNRVNLRSLFNKNDQHNSAIGKQVEKDKDTLHNEEFDATVLEPCMLWDKPVSEFKLEYLDLDEFLTENGIPVQEKLVQRKKNRIPPVEVPIPESTSTTEGTNTSSSEHSYESDHPLDAKSECKYSTSTVLDPISDVRGFDPSNCALLDEELKPHVVGKKSSKQFVPEEFKDEKYWVRRRKNNLAAKRSREARRMKENQIVMRASYLEKENLSLREEIKKLMEENYRLQQKMKRLENN